MSDLPAADAVTSADRVVVRQFNDDGVTYTERLATLGQTASQAVNSIVMEDGTPLALLNTGDGLQVQGGAISVEFGTAARTAAEGNDARIVGALQSSGGTMTGPLELAGDAASALEPVTRRQLDAAADGLIAATSAQLVLDFSLGDVVLTDDQLAGYASFAAIDAIADQKLLLPFRQKQFTLFNQTDFALSVSCLSEASPISIAAGTSATLRCDGQVVLPVLGVAGDFATLDSNGHLSPDQIPPGLLGEATPLGAYNAATNTPAIASGGVGGSAGDFYRVTVAGTVAADAIGAVAIGDLIENYGTAWGRIPLSDGYGTVAVQDADDVLLTGGAITGQSVLGLTGGDSFRYAASDLAAADIDAHYLATRIARNDGTHEFLYDVAFRANTDTTGTHTAGELASGTLTLTAGGTVSAAPADADYFLAFVDRHFVVSLIWDAAGWRFTDALSVAGNLAIDGTASAATLEAETVSFAGTSDSMLAADIAGIAFGQINALHLVTPLISDAGEFLGVAADSGSATGFSDDYITAFDSQIMAQSALMRSQTLIGLPGFTTGVLHFPAYGQSLSIPAASSPALSTTPSFDNKMIGDSVHPLNDTITTFSQFGTAAFSPLVATVRGNSNNLLDAAAQAALPSDTTFAGESLAEGALKVLRGEYLAERGLTEDPDHLFVATSSGVGGKRADELDDPATPHYFGRLTGAATLCKSVAGSASYSIPALLFDQGQADYSAGTTKAAYKVALSDLFDNFDDLVVTDVSGQARKAIKFVMQTSGSFVHNGVAVSQAQLELAQERSADVVLVGPTYGATHKADGHYDANGARWMANKLGQVLHQVLGARRPWWPLHPLSIVARGAEILVGFYVPVPPIAFGQPIVGYVATDFADKGFSVSDDHGAASLASVEIVGQATIRLTATRSVAANNPVVTAGNKTTFDGVTCVCDSDASPAADSYVYTPGSGQDTACNIAGLVGLPYDMRNWCVLFSIGATEV